jgi:citrate synthase
MSVHVVNLSTLIQSTCQHVNMTGERLLTTEDVARRLGVKRRTVYAYVSRGLLAGRRHADGKESLFAEADVAAFAASRKRPAAIEATPAIHTGITLISGGELYYRSRNVRDLAIVECFEAVVGLLWTGELSPALLVPSPDLQALAEVVTEPLPAETRLTDRLRVAVPAMAAVDALRFGTSPAAVTGRGGAILATMVAALPVRVRLQPTYPNVFAGMLWARLTERVPTAADLVTLNAALVLLADHDLAASTYAARVAASTRAHPYAVVQAGLAALEGPLHGSASNLAYGLLTETMQSQDPVGAIAGRLRADGWVAGFGHPLYPDGDPRAKILLSLLTDSHKIEKLVTEQGGMDLADHYAGRGHLGLDDGTTTVGQGGSDELPAGWPERKAVRVAMAELTGAMTVHSGAHPTIDFALAAFALLNGMDADAGETIFAVARTAGWLAHALEEYADEPSRFRPSGRYAGRRPQVEND